MASLECLPGYIQDQSLAIRQRSSRLNDQAADHTYGPKTVVENRAAALHKIAPEADLETAQVTVTDMVSYSAKPGVQRSAREPVEEHRLAVLTLIGIACECTTISTSVGNGFACSTDWWR